MSDTAQPSPVAQIAAEVPDTSPQIFLLVTDEENAPVLLTSDDRSKLIASVQLGYERQDFNVLTLAAEREIDLMKTYRALETERQDRVIDYAYFTQGQYRQSHPESTETADSFINWVTIAEVHPETLDQITSYTDAEKVRIREIIAEVRQIEADHDARAAAREAEREAEEAEAAAVRERYRADLEEVSASVALLPPVEQEAFVAACRALGHYYVSHREAGDATREGAEQALNDAFYNYPGVAEGRAAFIAERTQRDTDTEAPQTEGGASNG